MIKKAKKTSRSPRSTKSTKKTQVIEDEVVPKSSKSYLYLVIILIVIITAVILMVMNKFKPDAQPLANDNAAQHLNVNDPEDLVKRVGELIVIDKNEQPTVATVQDATLLRENNPEFYKDAADGDRLVIWSDKAVLYSTKLDKLLAVMPISQDEAMQQLETEPATSTQMTATTSTEMDLSALVQEEKPLIQVRNGTRIPGMARRMSVFLEEHDLDVAVVSDAVLKTYVTSTIFRLTDEPMPATEESLENVLGLEISDELPDEETTSGGDYVVIIGSDYAE